jgi:hypothetical protein
VKAADVWEHYMKSLHKNLVISLLFLGFAPCPFAEERKSDQSTTPAASPRALTGKERLGPKWTDEQRIDNCKVPLDKRGGKPRPSACANDPPS